MMTDSKREQTLALADFLAEWIDNRTLSHCNEFLSQRYMALALAVERRTAERCAEIAKMPIGSDSCEPKFKDLHERFWQDREYSSEDLTVDMIRREFNMDKP